MAKGLLDKLFEAREEKKRKRPSQGTIDMMNGGWETIQSKIIHNYEPIHNCIFCQKYNNKNIIIGETKNFYLILDEYPVTEGHTLIISKLHRENYSDLTSDEKSDLTKAIDLSEIYIKSKYDIIEFNVGFNTGVAAGQSIMHFHCHVIPRREGDVEEPKGGVRGVIQNKQKY